MRNGKHKRLWSRGLYSWNIVRQHFTSEMLKKILVLNIFSNSQDGVSRKANNSLKILTIRYYFSMITNPLNRIFALLKKYTFKTTSLIKRRANRQNQRFQLVMAGILWVILPTALMHAATNDVDGWIGNKTWCKCECCPPMETIIESVCFLVLCVCVFVDQIYILFHDILCEKNPLAIWFPPTFGPCQIRIKILYWFKVHRISLSILLC